MNENGPGVSSGAELAFLKSDQSFPACCCDIMKTS